MALKFLSGIKNTVVHDVDVVNIANVTQAIDDYVEDKNAYDMALKELEPLKARVAAAKKTLFEYVDEHTAPEDERVLEGFMHSIVASPKYKEGELAAVDVIYEKLDVETFLAVAKIGITELKRYLTPEEFDKVCTYRNSGARRLKVKS